METELTKAIDILESHIRPYIALPEDADISEWLDEAIQILLNANNPQEEQTNEKSYAARKEHHKTEWKTYCNSVGCWFETEPDYRNGFFDALENRDSAEPTNDGNDFALCKQLYDKWAARCEFIPTDDQAGAFGYGVYAALSHVRGSKDLIEPGGEEFQLITDIEEIREYRNAWHEPDENTPDDAAVWFKVCDDDKWWEVGEYKYAVGLESSFIVLAKENQGPPPADYIPTKEGESDE